MPPTEVTRARHVPAIHNFLGYCPWRPLPFPAALRRARRAVGLGQREIAERLGTVQEVYRHWEKGRYRPSKKFREAILEFLGTIGLD